MLFCFSTIDCVVFCCRVVDGSAFIFSMTDGVVFCFCATHGSTLCLSTTCVFFSLACVAEDCCLFQHCRWFNFSFQYYIWYSCFRTKDGAAFYFQYYGWCRFLFRLVQLLVSVLRMVQFLFKRYRWWGFHPSL